MFGSQFTSLNNNHKIPETQFYIANTKLLSVKFECKDLSNILRSLDVYKAHGHGNFCIRMLKICDFAIVESLSIIFNSCVDQNQIYALFIKKVTNNNYWSLSSSLVPVCGKILERLIFNSLYKYFEETNWL